MAAVADLGDGGRLPAPRGLGEVAGGGGAAGGHLREHGGGSRLDEALRAPPEGDAPGDRFEAPARAAAAGRSRGVEHDVADLPRQPLRPPVEAPIDHQPAPDARPEGRVKEVARPPPRAETVLPEGGRGSVVLDGDGDAEAFGKGLREREVAEGRDVRRDHHPASLRVDEAGHGEGGGSGRGRGPLANRLEEFADAFEHTRGGGVGRRRDLVADEHLARVVDEGGAQVRPTEVAGDDGAGHAGTVREARLSLDTPRVRPHPSPMEPWQVRLLADERSGVLGTIARSGLPQLVPVCYALVGDAIAIAIDEKPKRGTTLARVRNIERDPRATLLVDHYEERWERLAWLRLEGHADILEQGSAWPEALEALRRRYPRYRSMALEGLPVIRLRPARVVGWRWQDTD